MKPRETAQRSPLSRERIVRAGVELADQSGVESLSMRSLASALGVQAMSLYNHVSNKDELLDSMVDSIFTEIAASTDATGAWQTVIRQRAISVCVVLSRHPWAVAMLESSSLPGPATMRHFDDVLGCLRQAGFSVEKTLHAYTVIFAYVYGFVLALRGDDHVTQARQIIDAPGSADYPHAVEATNFYIERGYFDQTLEFVSGLDLILDALGRTLPG